MKFDETWNFLTLLSRNFGVLALEVLELGSFGTSNLIPRSAETSKLEELERWNMLESWVTGTLGCNLAGTLRP